MLDLHFSLSEMNTMMSLSFLFDEDLDNVRHFLVQCRLDTINICCERHS